MRNVISDPQRARWDETGWLHLANGLDPDELAAVRAWTDELAHRPEAPGRWTKYFENDRMRGDGRILCRMENFVPFHDGFAHLLLDGPIAALAAQLLDEPAVLFKEKINFKLPGGGAFLAHQDGPAYSDFLRYSLSVMLAIDEAGPENGGLEVARGRFREPLAQTACGDLAPSVVEALSWRPISLQAGDLLFFDCHLPHRSGPNRTRPRRALFATYNPASDGDHRERYFERKRALFPPECERQPGEDYSEAERIYNLGNPIE
ncbi:MAG: phytanoyl-CoA dioxygenase family protein [Acidobacteriota bacterium]